MLFYKCQFMRRSVLIVVNGVVHHEKYFKRDKGFSVKKIQHEQISHSSFVFQRRYSCRLEITLG